MKTVFIIDGGAGRIIAAIPALLKYAKKNVDQDWCVLIGGWDYLLWGIPELQDRTFNIDNKGVFDNFIRDCEKIVTPEPYRVPAYFRQEISLAQAFDREINNTTDHSDLSPPVLYINKQETLIAKNTLIEVKQAQKKNKTIVFQPFGRGAKIDPNHGIFDEESRSMDPKDYLYIAKRLAVKYNMIFFGEPDFQLRDDTFSAKFNCDLRQWSAIISESDYFVGVDSVGQHMAKALGVPGTVLFGSTYPINTSYPDFFQIIEKPAIKKYAPIRISGIDSMLANRLNESTMKYTTKELDDITNLIITDLEKKVK